MRVRVGVRVRVGGESQFQFVCLPFGSLLNSNYALHDELSFKHLVS